MNLVFGMKHGMNTLKCGCGSRSSSRPLASAGVQLGCYCKRKCYCRKNREERNKKQKEKFLPGFSKPFVTARLTLNTQQCLHLPFCVIPHFPWNHGFGQNPSAECLSLKKKIPIFTPDMTRFPKDLCIPVSHLTLARPGVP